VAAESCAGRPLRVALLEPAGRGGIHHYSRALAAALATAGVDLLFATARDHEFAARDEVAPPKFRLVPLFDRWRSSPRRILSELRAFSPDLLHLQAGTHPLLHLGLLISAKLATGARAVVTAHDLVPKNSSRLGALASGLLQRAADRIVVHGETLARELAQRVPAAAARVRVVPHGESTFVLEPARAETDGDPDVRPGAAVDGGTPTILFFGYLHEEKGLPDLIEALPLVAARIPAVRLVIAGQPELDVEPLKDQAARLQVADRIEWRLRYVDAAAIGGLFEPAQVVVLPYRRASQSGVVFLAGAFARPLVATRVGALPEVVDDGRTGRLVTPGAPRELAAALSELLSDPLRARKMGREHARRCRSVGSWSAIAERTRALYAELVPATCGRVRPRGRGGGLRAASRAGDRELVARP
jgi:glycosyltransferase involved in cell wall biosynthesis